MKPSRNNHHPLTFRTVVRNSMETIWLCYSSPTPRSAGHVFGLLVLCLLLSAATASLLYYWLTDLLIYNVRTALVAVGVCSTSVFFLSLFIHPFRCTFTLIFPTLFTRQGRKLLLSTSVMIVVLYVLPNMAENISTLTHAVKCASQSLTESLLSSSELINNIKNDMANPAHQVGNVLEILKTLNGFHQRTAIDVREVKQKLYVLSRQVQEDFSEVKNQIQYLKLLFSRIFAAFLVLYLFTDSVMYLHSYLSSLKFDNMYITSGLRRKAAEKGVVVEEKDVKNGVSSNSFKITKRELLKCVTPAVVITLYLLITIFLIVLDYFLYFLVESGGPMISNMPPTRISIDVNFKVGTDACQFIGFNCPADWFNIHRPYKTQSALIPCETKPSKLDTKVLIALAIIYLFSYTLLPLEVYARRLRRKVASSFFQQQEEKRVEFLIKKIQTKQRHQKITDQLRKCLNISPQVS